MLCNDQTAAVLKRAGKSGRKTLVDTSPKTSAAPTFLETTDNEGETSIAWTSGQEGWEKESSMKSTGCASAAAAGGGGGGDGKRGGIERIDKPEESTPTTGGGLERASATTFSEPGVCLRSVVNSETYARWRCWRADCGGETRVMAATSGLWSVRSWNCLPSNKKRKWRMVEKAANNSLSKVEYFASAEVSFFE
jgi:hypothetical protein